jgi:hypothetical protein
LARIYSPGGASQIVCDAETGLAKRAIQTHLTINPRNVCRIYSTQLKSSERCCVSRDQLAMCFVSENSPSSAKHMADDTEVFWVLAKSFAPTLTSIPSRLEFLRGYLRSKFGTERYSQYHHQMKNIVTATNVSSTQREVERVVSMLKIDDTLKYFAVFVELLQLETFAGLS